MDLLRNVALQVYRQALLPYYKQRKKSTTPHGLMDALNFRMNQILLQSLSHFINSVSLYKKRNSHLFSTLG